MPYHTYKLFDGAYVSTNVEPPEWDLRWPISDADFLALSGAADIVVEETGEMVVIVGDAEGDPIEPEVAPE